MQRGKNRTPNYDQQYFYRTVPLSIKTVFMQMIFIRGYWA